MSEQKISRRKFAKYAAGAVAAAAVAGGLGYTFLAPKPGRRDISFITWAGYESESILSPFEKEYDTSVTTELITDDPGVYNKFVGGAVDLYDIMITDNIWTQKHAEANTIIPLNEDKFVPVMNEQYYEHWRYPNYRWTQFNNKLYGIVYRWGYTGFTCNFDKLSEEERSDFMWFWKPENRGKYGVLDWMDWSYQDILRTMGLNPWAPSFTDAEYEDIRKMTIDLFTYAKGVFTGMTDANYAFLSGEIDAIIHGSNFLISALRRDGYRQFNVWPPKQHYVNWVELESEVNNPNLSELADDFIMYMISRPDVGAKIAFAEATQNPVANRFAMEELTPDQLEVILPSTLSGEANKPGDAAEAWILAHSIDNEGLKTLERLGPIWEEGKTNVSKGL